MPDVVDPPWFALGLAAPAFIAGAAMLLALPSWPIPRAPPAARAALTGNLGIGAAMLIGIAAAFGPPHLLDTLADPLRLRWQDALSLITVAAALIEALAPLHAVARRVAWPLRLALIAAAPWLLLAPIIRHDWPTSHTLAWTASSAVALLALVIVGRANDRPRPTRDLPFPIALATAAAAAAIALSGSISIGQLAASLAAAIAAAGLAALRLPRDATAATSTLTLLIYGCLIIVAYHYTFDPYHHREGLHRHTALLLAAAPFLPVIAALPRPARIDRPALRVAARWLLILTPAAAALALAAARNW